MKKTSSILFVGLLLLAACSSAVGPSPTPTATLQPTATALPTPASPGDTIVWQNLQVTMDQTGITQDY
ncbi:MAG TPA: hypothetical protein VLE49_00435, partial [Anaerolineales bacterium]|nr:hypothetical protein [Anaerolineales bacterium]